MRDRLPTPQRVHTRLNDDLVKTLERSYYQETDIELWVGDCPETRELVSQGRLFARRTGTSFTFRFGKRDGRDYMVFSLKPRRSYVKADTEFWENR